MNYRKMLAFALCVFIVMGQVSVSSGADREAIITITEDLNRPISPFITGAGLNHLYSALRPDFYSPVEGGPSFDQLTEELGITMLRYSHGILDVHRDILLQHTYLVEDFAYIRLLHRYFQQNILSLTVTV